MPDHYFVQHIPLVKRYALRDVSIENFEDYEEDPLYWSIPQQCWGLLSEASLFENETDALLSDAPGTVALILVDARAV